MNEERELSGRVEFGSVRFYKRLIVVALSIVLIGLSISCAVLAVRNHGLRAELRTGEVTIRRLEAALEDQKKAVEALGQQLSQGEGAGTGAQANKEPEDKGTLTDAEVSRSMDGRSVPSVDFELLTQQINEGQASATVSLSEKSAVVPAKVFTAISNRADEVDVVFELGDYRWSAKSLEVYQPKRADSYDLRAGVKTLSAEEAATISIPQMNAVLRITVASEVLPKTIRLTFEAGAEYAGKTLYLYHLDSDQTYQYGGSATVDGNGRVTLPVAYGQNNVITVLK